MVNMNKFIVICIDGWDYEYINYHKMEFISLKKRSFTKPVKSMMPSVTNVNNLSIISGVYPSKHGICSNYNYSKNLNQGIYLEDNKYVMSETIFNICNKKNLTSILATSKNKLKTLLINNNFNNNLSYSTENPSTFLIKKFGEAPSIYTIKANSWTISTASMLIYEKSPDFSYISLTDYPMHKFKPESTHSLEHLKLIDESICELINKNPDYQIFITADHGMSDKTKLVNIENELSKYNDSRPKDFKLEVRIGIHIGDVVKREDGDIHGDGVNVAARIQPLASPGGICVSGAVSDALSSHPDYDVISKGEQELKNILQKHSIFQVKTGYETIEPQNYADSDIEIKYFLYLS